ncbi:protein ATP6V1FNB [Sorex araneus]|uniref:protein ATP6V1FNB n=1 Tax=Sorex araneus TaxID=42254 RepID=UPI0024334D46|nr:protein ATP6V1FNB [Sorex araneus]
MRDLFNTHNHAFWHERLRKETAVRVAWQLKFGQRTWKAGPLPRKQVQKAPLRAAPSAGARPSTPALRSAEARGKGPDTKETPERGSRAVEAQGTPPQAAAAPGTAAVQPGRAGPPSPDGLEMRKAPARALQLLYSGVSQEGQGRAAYLRERHRQKPEEKFQYPVLSSWQYGWHVGDAMKDARPPTYGRCNPITKSFYIRNSVFRLLQTPDPRM